MADNTQYNKFKEDRAFFQEQDKQQLTVKGKRKKIIYFRTKITVNHLHNDMCSLVQEMRFCHSNFKFDIINPVLDARNNSGKTL